MLAGPCSWFHSVSQQSCRVMVTIKDKETKVQGG